MLHLLIESGDGNSELKGRRFPLGKNIYVHLKETLDNYKGDKSVEGYKRLVNIITMNNNEGGILYNEMKRIKNFFDNYNGSKDSVNYILNGGEPMENWVRNTLNTAIETVKGFKQAKAMGGLNNSFRKEHTKDRIVKPPKETKIKMSDINKNLLNVAGSGFKITKPNKVKSSVNEKHTFYITEEQQRRLLNEITIKDKFEKEQGKTKWSNPRDFQRICQSDPTYNREKDIVGKYTNWLLLRLNDLSDLERVKVPLEWYADGMKRGILQRQGISPDINAYKSVDDFISAMQTVMKSGDEPMQSASEMNNREKFAGQFKVIGQSKYWEVISPLTFEAERWFGRKTEWCTVANEDYFDRYGGYEGKLFIFYPKNGELETRIQVHFRSNSYFDVDDDGYHNIAEALESHNPDEYMVNDGVKLANNLWDLGLRYIKFKDVPELLAQGVDPKEIFQVVGKFSEGFACVQLKGKENYINDKNQLLSDKWFDYVNQIKNDFGIVELDGLVNFINTKGEILSTQWFDGAQDFTYDGFGVVYLRGKGNFINTKGKILSPQWFDDVNDFENGFAIVMLETKHNLINTKGQILSPQWFDDVNNFYDEVARVKLNDKWNYINMEGQLVTQQWFDWAGMFNYGISVVELNGKGNFINTKGEILSPQWFDRLSGFETGVGAVMLNGKCNFITKDMKFLSPQWFDELTRFYNGLGGVKLNDKWNFINMEGQILSPQWFDYVFPFKDGFAEVELNDKYNFINTKGQILYKPNELSRWFDCVRNFNSGGFAVVEVGYNYFWLRSDGVLFDYSTKEPIPELNESKSNRHTFYITEEQSEKLRRNMLNEEIIKKNINSIINEELSISKDVEDISFEIFSNIKKHGFVKGEENFSFNVGDILVSCFNYYFNSREEYEKEKPQKSANSVSHRGMRFINIALCYLSGHLVSNDLYDSIFHEVEHLYQQEKTKLNFQDRKDDDFYRFVEGLMYKGETLEERTVAAGLYLSFDYELNGYLNGLYGQLKETDPQPNEVDKIVKESALYQMISHAEEALKLLSSPDGDKYAEPYTIKYNLSKKYLINRLKRTLKTAYKKIGKIIVRFKKNKLSIMRDVNLYENFWYKIR